jgi:hypothetical protein
VNRALWLVIAAGCGSSSANAPAAIAPQREVFPVDHASLCVTKGAIANKAITEPTVRAFALGTSGDAAQLTFTYASDSSEARALESGEVRRQVGLKLRAQNSCNVVYVMWRISPKPGLQVQVKHNPGKVHHEECGIEGYLKVKPAAKIAVPALVVGTTHTLRAEILGDELHAWIDGRLAWRGELPEDARAISGPAGLRTDNVRLDALELSAPRGETPGLACKQHETEDE